MESLYFEVILEYPEYAEGLTGALFGLFFIRQNGFIDNDPSGMYGGKMIWYDGTPAITDFSSFYDHSFNPRVNKSNCYRFMTWAMDDNDCERNLKLYKNSCILKSRHVTKRKYKYEYFIIFITKKIRLNKIVIRLNYYIVL